MSKRIEYRKRDNFHVTAVRLDLDFDGFSYRKWNNEQTSVQGDWLLNNGGDIYTVAADYFHSNYQEISPGQFNKIGAVWAEEATEDGDIDTLEGKTSYETGDYLVFDRAVGGDAYAIKKCKFELMYEPVEMDEHLTARQTNYLKRLDGLVARYDNKATRSRFYFYLFQTVAVIAAASVPVFSSMPSPENFLIASLGGLSAAISGMLSLFQFQTNWIKFRSTCEDLKSHLAQFRAVAGMYKDRRKAFNLLVENCEQLISVERGQWAQNNSRQDENKENK
ncbi:DUF4231 domain-containing protein [Alteromonas gracilis]|uniref:DUF4231 domain-containing protein n=1 Tax=Alteromonas gracilis TaxID=1479524 RepID=A0ABX5CKU4_9ALTE|nr:DUF4231 domain-containing protein [Alteromonas gracilis]PRO68023.1 hypothetical protein C6Y39_15445 [Alteromonas gracilis]